MITMHGQPLLAGNNQDQKSKSGSTMQLSDLQRYILVQALAANRTTIHKEALLRFYSAGPKRLKPKDEISDLTRSVERLIDRGLVIGYGSKTAQRWFVTEVRLTPPGRRLARELLGTQQLLPLRSARSKLKTNN